MLIIIIIQGYDLEMATNCMGPFLLTCLLEPLLVKTAGPEKPADVTLTSTRIVWVSSWLAAGTPKGGIEWDADRNAPKVIKNAMMNYMQSKVGNVFLASEAARHLKEKGIISLVGLCPRLYYTLSDFKPECESWPDENTTSAE